MQRWGRVRFLSAGIGRDALTGPAGPVGHSKRAVGSAAARTCASLQGRRSKPPAGAASASAAPQGPPSQGSSPDAAPSPPGRAAAPRRFCQARAAAVPPAGRPPGVRRAPAANVPLLDVHHELLAPARPRCVTIAPRQGIEHLVGQQPRPAAARAASSSNCSSAPAERASSSRCRWRAGHAALGSHQHQLRCRPPATRQPSTTAAGQLPGPGRPSPGPVSIRRGGSCRSHCEEVSLRRWNQC